MDYSQFVDCSDITLTPTIKNSACYADGSISVALGGSHKDNLKNIQWSLSGVLENSEKGVEHRQPQSSPLFENLSAGTYTITMQANCQNNPSEVIVKKLENIRITSNYKPYDVVVRDIHYVCPTILDPRLYNECIIDVDFPSYGHWGTPPDFSDVDKRSDLDWKKKAIKMSIKNERGEETVGVPVPNGRNYDSRYNFGLLPAGRYI